MSKGQGPAAHFKKTNYIIEAKYKLGVMETFLFTQAYMTLAENDHSPSHKIYFKDVIENFGLHPKGDTYDHIVRAARSLRLREIVFRPVSDDGEEEVEVFTGFFTKVKVHKRRGNDLAYLEVFIDPDLRPHLIALKRYTLLNKDRYAWICGCLRNPLIIRLYDLLKQYEKIGWRRFQVQELKSMLQIEEQYKLYGNFKQKVILEAQRLFKQYADIGFSFKEEKQGKAVNELVFIIFANVPEQATEAVRRQLMAEFERRESQPPPQDSKGSDPTTATSALFEELFQKLKLWSVSKERLQELLREFDEARLRHAIAHTEQWWQEGKIKGNVGGFFIKALREGWKTADEIRLEQLRERKRREAESRREAEMKINALQIQLDALVDARRGAINQIIKEMTATDPSVAMRAVQGIKENAALVRTLRRVHGISNLEELQIDDYRQNPVLREQVIREIIRQHSEKFETVRQQFEESIGQLETQIKKWRSLL